MDFRCTRMALRNLTAIGIVITLMGCNPAPQTMQPSFDVYSVAIPESASHKYIRDDESIAYSTYEAPTNTFAESDFLIEIYPPETDQICSSENLGIFLNKAAIEKSSLMETIRGKVNFYEVYGSRGQGWVDYAGPPPVCAPSPFGHMNYAFCSKNKNRTVVICVSQAKDNPQQAKEVFDSFHWN